MIGSLVVLVYNNYYNKIIIISFRTKKTKTAISLKMIVAVSFPPLFDASCRYRCSCYILSFLCSLLLLKIMFPLLLTFWNNFCFRRTMCRTYKESVFISFFLCWILLGVPPLCSRWTCYFLASLWSGLLLLLFKSSPCILLPSPCFVGFLLVRNVHTTPGFTFPVLPLFASVQQTGLLRHFFVLSFLCLSLCLF